MKKIRSLLTLAFTFVAASALAMPQPSRLELEPDFLAQIHALFPEGREVSPSLLDFDVDPNLRLFREAEVRLTFIDEAADYLNSVGYFLYQDSNQDGLIEEGELQNREILFPNASREGSGGELKPGDTLSLGRFPAGTRIGFFLIADGAADPRENYYTLDALNPDGRRHLAMLALPDREHVILGMEDLPAASGDRDFNDLLFTLTTEPKSALSEAIEDSRIPVASRPPAPVPEASPSPASQEPNQVMLQESKGPPMIEGSGLGCQVGGSGRLEGASSLLLGLILIWLFRHFSMHWRDILEIFRMPKRRPFRFRLHENLAPIASCLPSG